MDIALQNWINSADNVRHLRFFSIAQIPIHLAHVINRTEDYYISLVGELFNSVNAQNVPRADWAQLGNAFLQFSAETSNEQLAECGISKDDATFFAAAAFYFGDYPASALLAMRHYPPPTDTQSLRADCFDFLARPQELRSQTAITARQALRSGDMRRMDRLVASSALAERRALSDGPTTWIPAKLLSRLLGAFQRSNLRAVLPNGHLEFWTPLVRSLIDRQPSTWEFFPSQIEAIQGGLLASNESYSLQMPTGAGKTTLCETLLFWHLISNPADVAIMLVPYRSLASELRNTLVRRLNDLGIASRCAYGGTVPTGNEVHDLANVRAIIATPEALSGLLGADPAFTNRIALVVCDEGHLLDGEGRGIGLELLLARLRARQIRRTRFVFMSAIVPNIEEINAWLGGNDQTVIRSTYRPAIAEFSVIRPAGTGANTTIRLEMHPHQAADRQFSIDRFLSRTDFMYLNPESGRYKTYGFDSIKTQAIAAARKVLPMGATAIFATNKRGTQGAIGIAESFVEQLQYDLPLPKPIDFARQDALQKVVAYLEAEYGPDWIGTKSVRHGAVLHHGDIPQETREVFEELIRKQDVKLVICTSTLAEGVNLPIRTLVLYSVQRRVGDGRIQNMLARDIKNLVGRAGRAGSNTKGLVIGANADQWPLIEPVALQGAGEAVKGALLGLVDLITRYLAASKTALSNQFLEQNTIIYPLIDGVDATLIELLSDEIGEAEFVDLATNLADQTFAARQLPPASTANLRTIFALRATRMVELRANGRTAWARETGAKPRLIDSVEQRLLPSRADWQAEVDPLADELRTAIFEWAWTHGELHEAVKECFRLRPDQDVEAEKGVIFEIARCWMAGTQFRDIAGNMGLAIDDLLAVQIRGVTFALQTLVEQGLSLLAKRLHADGIEIAKGVIAFSEHLRFGVPTVGARLLAASGLRHRKACVLLGDALQTVQFEATQLGARTTARASLQRFPDAWRTALGELQFQNTVSDLAAQR